MRPTEILMQEHRVIEQVLDCLELIAEKSSDKGVLDVESAEQAIDFFRNFADRCHHGKEEDCLFPLLESKGFSREQGPTGVMLEEHEAGRNHVRGMVEAISAVVVGNQQAQETFVSHAVAYVQLLRQHIQKEDHCLFQMADQTLSAEDQKQLLESFAHVEHDDLGPGTHERYLDIATDLVNRYGVRCGSDKIPASSHCCGQH